MSPAADERNHIPVVVSMSRLPVNNRRAKTDRARTLIDCRARATQPTKKQSTDANSVREALSCMVLNARSLARTNAFQQLTVDVSNCDPDIVCVCETWLKIKHASEYFTLE
jgi:hypothetical protein